jgi:hypothetical protein
MEPDDTVPSEKLELPEHRLHRINRDIRFALLPFGLVRNLNVPAYVRLFLVLKGYSDMRKNLADKRVPVTAAVCADAGVVNKDQKARALARLEALGLINVERRVGKNPRVLVLPEGTSS